MKTLGRLITAVLAAVLTSICTANTCTPPPQGLVHWWPGENSGADIVGSVNGTRFFGATFSSGNVGQSFSFDGVDDYMHAGMLGNIGLSESSPLSIAAWINALELSRADMPQVIASNYMGERGGTDSYSMYLAVYDNALQFAINRRQIAGDSVSVPFAAGWHFVVATYDGSNLKLYVDGVLTGSATRSFSGSSSNTRGWNIGDYSPETNASHASYGYRNGAFNGQIDELQLFDVALNDTQVTDLYTAGSAGVCMPPVPSLDIDGSVTASRYTALTDGVLVMRYLFGLRGAALVNGATGDTASRDADAIHAYLDGMLWALDVDDNGLFEGATDGLLVVRYLLGFRGTALTADALGPFAGRTSATAIETYLQSLTL